MKDSILLKYQYFPTIYRFTTISSKIFVSYFKDINKLIVKLIWKGKKSKLAIVILKEKNKVGGLTLIQLQELVRQCDFGEEIDKYVSETESPEIYLYKYRKHLFQ